jgi:hypothetical protein
MVQTTQARMRSHRRLGCRLLVDRAAIRRILFQAIVNPVVVMVAHVVADQSAEMLFIPGDDMVQDLAPNTSHPSFSDPVLPRRLDARPFWFQTRRLQKRHHVSIEFRVVVEDYVSIRGSFGKRFAQLLDDPIRCRVLGHVVCRILLRPCSMTKKQYSNWNVSVATVKKSKAETAYYQPDISGQ